MKKEYIKPFSKTYAVSPIHMVAESIAIGGDGKLDPDENGVGAREDNSNNGGNSIWDNAW